jgi:hypothetical protein
MNDSGAIVGTATYTPPPVNGVPSTPVQHGALLLPCQFSLLNGAQSGPDGVDFKGFRPQTLNDGDIDPDNPNVSNDSQYSDKLGPLIDGSGNLLSLPDNYSDASVFGLLMMAKVSAEPNITYKWNRTFQQRSWNIAKSTDGTQWNVVSTYQPTGFPNSPIEDTKNLDVLNNIPSPNHILYYHDIPGENLLSFSLCKVGDYAYEETHFVYTLTITIGSATTTRSIGVGQRILSQRTGTGTSSSDWKYIYNTVGTTDIPNCVIDKSKVSAIVGNDGLTIHIFTDANNNIN